MAAFGPIEFCGIAVGRAVTIYHGTADDMDSSSSEISFSSLDVDEEKVTRPLPGGPLTQSASPPPFSFTHIVPEDMFLTDMGSVTAQRAVGGDLGMTHGLAPLDRFASTPQRHEKIALAMALHTRIESPYQDYVPCPGSGPGSPALSVATDHIRPGVAPSRLEPPLPRMSVGKLALGSLAHPHTLLNAGPTPMSRFLADAGPNEWMAPTFHNTTVLPTIEVDDGHLPLLSSAEPSLILDETRSHARQDGSPASVEAKRDIFHDDHRHTVLEELESAASRKHARGLNFDDVLAHLIKQLGDQRQERILKGNLPRALRPPRKRESPPQKKRKMGDDGYQHHHFDS